MSITAAWLLYGANGYTGRLVAREAVRRGLRPVLAGRNAAAIAALARELGCESRVFDLADPSEVARHVAGSTVVLHCAGPFSATAEPMMEGCLRAGAHYLDITGEIDVIEAGAAHHQRASAAGVAMIPAVGFDVVPSDCLAATLIAALPSADRLELAFATTGGLSPGTAKTSVEGMPRGGRVRRAGRIESVPAVWKTMEVPFSSGVRTAATIPWGDVASAYHSTGVPNVEVYMAMPPRQIRALRRMRWLLPIASLGPIQRFIKRRIERSVAGPTQQQLAESRAWFWGRATDPAGQTAEATLETPGGYPLTVVTSLAFVEAALTGELPAGFSTPSRALGADCILRFPGTRLQWRARPAG